MLRIMILADDLSGAADCGVACVGAGLKTVVALGHSDDDPAADVLSLDSDTRSMAPEQAAREVDRLIRVYAANQETLLFKKIDSTLRGNVGQELAAALNALREVRNDARIVAIMAPAFPAIGRTTRNGMQFVHGQPLHELDIWRVQGMTGHAYIPDMLHDAGLKCEVLGLEMTRSGRSRLKEVMTSAANRSDVLVCDAETDDDLFAIDVASAELDRRPLWVGSAGLAYQLPRAAGLSKSVAATAPISLPAVNGALLFVIGSLSRNSLEQVRVLSSMSGTRVVCVPPEVLLAGDGHAEWVNYAQELEAAIRLKQDVVLSPKTEPRFDLSQRPLVAAALARMAVSVASGVGALIASGGETARAVFESLGVNRLRLLGELEKGIPVSMTENWNRQLPVITKAGDFGSTDTLLKCSQFLHRENSRFTAPLNSGKVVQ